MEVREGTPQSDNFSFSQSEKSVLKFWQEKQIFKKTQVRIDNLEKATSSRPTANGTPDVPSLDDIKTIRDIRFHMNGDTPELRSAVQKQM